MPRQGFDVVVVGAGPAGIFAALELSQNAGLKVAILEKGPAIERRRCLAREGKGCAHCRPCAILSGWGGAGAFDLCLRHDDCADFTSERRGTRSRTWPDVEHTGRLRQRKEEAPVGPRGCFRFRHFDLCQRPPPPNDSLSS